MDTPDSYVLKHPIEFGDETITELRFKPMCAEHNMGLPDIHKETHQHFFKLAERLTGKAPAILKKLRQEDWLQVVLILGKAEGGGSSDGESTSEGGEAGSEQSQ